MQMEAGVFGQPLLHVRVLVRSVVIQDHVDLQLVRHLLVDGAQNVRNSSSSAGQALVITVPVSTSSTANEVVAP